jgi:hypothetical protein
MTKGGKFPLEERSMFTKKGDIELPVQYGSGEDSMKMLKKTSFLMGSTFNKASRNLNRGSRERCNTIIY